MTGPTSSSMDFERAAKARQQSHEQAGVEAPTHPLVRLNQAAGNGAVSRLLQRLQDSSVAQRDSAEEEEIQAKHDPAIQRNGMPEDEEIQMKADGPSVGLDGGALSDESAGAIDAMRGGGSGLSDTMRSTMEPALGVDLSGVRVHQDSESDTLARDMTARAFTTGSDIFLRSDANAGDTQLMAHELTHVAQQSSGVAGAGSGQRMSVGAADDPLEHEADDVAKAVVSGAEPARRSDEER